MWYQEINFITILGATISVCVAFYIYDGKIKEKLEQKVDKEDFTREIEKLHDRTSKKDNEVKEMIKELKGDINRRFDEIKEDINYLRDRECQGVGKR